jgi:3-deoxy-manno-octulosonate cytidylyltransferase (CMP-KDO synthetase)
MTSSDCLTGTDRLAEANVKLNCDFIINVQGDEPLIEPNDILKVINEYKNKPGNVVNAMCQITTEDEFRSFTVPKVVVSKTGNLLYMSRSPIPVNKNNGFSFGYKTIIEEVEDIEILRFLENDIPVKMIQVTKSSIAVDIPADVEKVVLTLESNS